MLKYYHSDDVNYFKFRDINEIRNILRAEPDYFETLVLVCGGNVYTVWADEKTPVMIGGWVSSAYANATLFMMPSVLLDEKFNKEILKDIKKVTDMPKSLFKRVDAIIADDEKNKRFIEFLGFSLETVLKKYNFDGSDMYLYVYLK